jgi:uncharacterized membrane protein
MLRSLLPWGRGLFWIIAAAFILVLVLTIGRLPPVVASHFNADGVPNGWSSRQTYGLLQGAIGVVLPLSLIALVKAVTVRGPHRLNIPAREYWRLPEHAPEAVRRVRAYMWWLGCILAGMALAVHGLVLRAHRSMPPHLSTSGIVMLLALLLLVIGIWTLGWYRLLLPPAR